MRNRLIAIIFLLFAFQAFASIPTEKYYDPQLGRYIEVAAGQILVKFKPVISSQSINALNETNQVQVVSRLPRSGVYQLSGKVSVADLLASYRADPSVEYAEPNHIVQAQITTPNDPSFSKQWGLNNIKAPQTWDIEKGASTVTIAVIDSGIDYNHEDLINRVVTGYDYVDNDNDPKDEYGHGTHVAGILGAQANNSVGIAGVNWDCKIMPIRVLGVDGSGYASNFAKGVTYAYTHGAKILNMSLSLLDGGYDATLNNEIQAAYAAGCIIIAAAGNDGDTTNYHTYPASCANVISVGAVDQYDSRTVYSNYNSNVAVCAPGGARDVAHAPTRIYSTMPSYTVYMNDSAHGGYYQNYDYMHGTSMATPFVAGFAGLLWAHNSTWTNVQIINAITSEVDHLGSGAAGTRNEEYGYGRINLYKAFNTTPPTPPTAPTAVQNGRQVTVSWTASTNTNVEKYYVYRGTSAAGTFTLVGSTAATSLTYADTITTAGTYYYKISAIDAAGLESSQTTAASVTVVFTIDTIAVYPNPFIIRTGSVLTFDGLNGTETIRIYTISGEQVFATTVSAVAAYNWNGRNTGNKQVARGVYLYLITRPTGEKRVGKFAVIG